MSSSPSRAPLMRRSVIPAPGKPVEAAPFPYSEVPAEQRPYARTDSAKPGGSESPTEVAAAQAREAGRQQGERDSLAKLEAQLAQARMGIAKALADFARERAAYYRKIETDAVKLALSIARKVLHREAQMDPQVLMGIVRVAMERIEGATKVVLVVHPQRAAAWREYMLANVDAGKIFEIVEENALPLEQCELRTSMGTAALGLEVQLKEIEQGLADLLAARPQATP
jgi:flagellar assembly protein FliH